MKENVTVPSMGESISSGIIAKWLKIEGDFVREDEDLFELETDKATVAVPASSSGRLHILIQEGETVEIGQDVISDTSHCREQRSFLGHVFRQRQDVAGETAAEHES